MTVARAGMTEALRPIRPAIPAISVGRQIGPSASGHDARAMAASRPRAESRRPVHLAIFVGLSAGAYAASLAGVTALQAATVQAVSDGYAPTSDAIDLLKTHHDELEARLQAATAAYNTAADTYGDVSGSLKAYEQQLQALAEQVTKIQGQREMGTSDQRRAAVGGGACRRRPQSRSATPRPAPRESRALDPGVLGGRSDDTGDPPLRSSGDGVAAPPDGGRAEPTSRCRARLAARVRRVRGRRTGDVAFPRLERPDPPQPRRR